MGRRRLGLPALVIGSIVLAAAAGAVARGFVSPAQQAAHAAPPLPSLITAPVRYGALPQQLVMRATVAHDDPVTVQPPQNLTGAAVVTSVNVVAGKPVRDGQLLGTVSEQPVFVMQGAVPAFRAMAPGVTGVDVRELQAGLTAAGYGIGADPSGVYGAGTAAAVLDLYRAAHVAPDVAPGADAAVAQRTTQLTRAEGAASAAAVRLATAQRHGVPRRRVAADRQALTSAEAEETAARRDLGQADRAAEPAVPLGAIAFLPHLPGQVLSVAGLGSTIGSGGSGSARDAKALAAIGSAKVTLTASAGQAALGELRPRMIGTASSSLADESVRVRVISASSKRASFVPIKRVPRGFVGQNVQVDVVAKRVRSLIVPIAAVSTSGSGRTYVTVARRSGRQRTVWVKLGLSTSGRQAVTTSGTSLRAGQQVVIGQQAR
jgi:HlyD family secretion protein